MSPQKPKLAEIVPKVVELSEEVGIEIAKIFRGTADFGIQKKADDSPLTIADSKAHELLEKGLKKITPKIPIFSEESENISYEERKKWTYYWLVDPLDGTKEFIAKRPHFTINIALIEKHDPIFGLVLAPALHELYFAVKGEGAYQKKDDMTLKELKVRELDESNLVAFASHSHIGNVSEDLKKIWPDIKLVTMGSALKFCKIATGEGDFYLRMKPTSEWDTAAGQCILEEAGGLVLDEAGEALHYNRRDIVNPNFIAFADPLLDWQKLFSRHPDPE